MPDGVRGARGRQRDVHRERVRADLPDGSDELRRNMPRNRRNVRLRGDRGLRPERHRYLLGDDHGVLGSTAYLRHLHLADEWCVRLDGHLHVRVGPDELLRDVQDARDRHDQLRRLRDGVLGADWRQRYVQRQCLRASVPSGSDELRRHLPRDRRDVLVRRLGWLRPERDDRLLGDDHPLLGHAADLWNLHDPGGWVVRRVRCLRVPGRSV